MVATCIQELDIGRACMLEHGHLRRKDQGLDKPVEGIRVFQAVQEPEYYLSHYFGQPVGDILQMCTPPSSNKTLFG